MLVTIKTELWKLKRYNMIWAGVLLMLLAILLTVFTTTAMDGTVWTFSHFADQVMKENITTIFPMCIALITGYIINRESMDDTLKKFYKKGCVTGESIAAFVSEAAKSDDAIKEILEKAGLSRPVSTRDRDYYRTWTYSWNMPAEVILQAAELSKKAESPLSYLNSVLATWHEKGIHTAADAAKAGALPIAKAAEHRIVTDFSADELNAAFAKLNEEL